MALHLRGRSRSPFVRISSCVLGNLIVLGFLAYSFAAAQALAPRPVARLITGTTDDSRPRRMSADNAGGNAGGNANTTVTASPSLAEATESERRAFEVTNELRLNDGFASLEWDAELCVIARRHSRDMSVLGFFSHQTPEGLRLKDRVRVAGIRYRVIAENIAYNQGFKDPGAFAVERWMISTGHRANLLSPEFRAAAVGSFVAADGTVFLTQIFILR